jgi:glycosyltransferase involved in cell wall biosynthesis
MKKRKSLSIGIIYPGRFPWNRGIGQLCGLLKDLGHNPVVFSRAIEKRFLGAKYNDFSFKIMRQENSILSRIKTYPVAINPLWRRFILERAKEIKADCLFVRETNLLKQAVLTAKSLTIPLFVLGLLFSTTVRKKGFNFLRTERFINLLERKYLKECNHILTVTEELRNWVINKYVINKENVSVLGNYPDRHYIAKAENVDVTRKHEFNSPVRFVYAGNLSKGKGIQDVIKSLPLVHQKHDCTLTVIGEGQYQKNLEDLVVEFGLQEKVIFKPLLPPGKVLETLAEFDIGICPYLVNEFSNQTMPGKLFEYMSVGLPVFSSARKPVSRIIKETRCGVIYHSRKPEEIAAKIIMMIDNAAKTLAMGLNGRKAVFSKYNNETSKKVVEQVLGEHFSQ